MATRKKSDPQLTENSGKADQQPAAEKKSGGKKNKPVSEAPAEEPVKPAAKKAATKKSAAASAKTTPPTPPQTEVKAQPVKKAAKKSSGKQTALPLETEETTQANQVPAAESTAAPAENTAEATVTNKPAKKAAPKRKPAAKPDVLPEVEPMQTPVTFTDNAADVIEHIEPVTVAEEKNAAFVHKLAEATPHTTDKKVLHKITFIVSFHSTPGQNLFITAQHPVFGNGNPDAALPMQYLDTQHWMAELPVGANTFTEDVIYNYLLKEADGSYVYESGKDKKITPSSYQKAEVTLIDAWNVAGFYSNAFYTEPFKNVLLKDNYTSAEYSEPATFTHTFRVKAPLLQQGQVPFLMGNADALHNWSSSDVLLLHKEANEDYWHINIDLSGASFPVFYKYGVYDVRGQHMVQIEEGSNRILVKEPAENNETVVSDGFIHLPDTTWKGTGVAIPVFSLRSQTSFGCGEFADIKKLVDWSKLVGLKLVQLLPVNDTTSTKTWRDSYPYAAISAFALHPMYLNMDSLVEEENKQVLNNYWDEAQRLNALPEIDYEAVNDIKWKIIHDIYPLQKEAVFASENYKQFFEDNKHWLVPYAAFCCLRDRYNTADFSKWQELKTYSEEGVTQYLQSAEEADRAGMYYFVQYHLHLQLQDAAQYAHSNGIVIKGDIAIGISRNSADAWQQPQLYNLDMQAGAPPDAFAVKGQNWGFPTYNWQKMKEDGFAWWKQRFSQMSNYFDAFRIDHILGFFRIWSIPTDAVEGILGHFVPALPVRPEEFQQRHIQFDYNRFCKPFINDQVLNDLFGDQQWYVKDTFLQNNGDGTYTLRPEVATQKRVETYFAIREQNPHNSWLKQTLFDVISNVILFEDKGSNGQAFHFRFGMEKTLSYQYLDDYTKQQLRELSVNYFYERQDEFWRHEAMQKLPALKQETDMLICGEDLGMVPATVPRVMRELGLLSLEVQRMPKDEKSTFTYLAGAPYLSVVTPSTHDMSTIRGWWEEDRNVTQTFYNQQLHQQGEAPQQCEPWINRLIVEQHLQSPAMWGIFQLQDLLGMNAALRRQNPGEERINVPAIPQYYWRYRMHLTLEDLLKADDFNNDLKEMVKASGR